MRVPMPGPDKSDKSAAASGPCGDGPPMGPRWAPDAASGYGGIAELGLQRAAALQMCGVLQVDAVFFLISYKKYFKNCLTLQKKTTVTLEA